jgi:hypothetical protein
MFGADSFMRLAMPMAVPDVPRLTTTWVAAPSVWAMISCPVPM